MIPRGWALVLCAYLLAWVPVGFAIELFSSLPSIGRRGLLAAAELTAHALAAIACAAAGWMLLIRAPAAATAAASAVVISAVASMQSLFWSALPRNIAPGARLPLAALTCGHAVFWLVVIGCYARRRRD
jgi:hypothetical protein